MTKIQVVILSLLVLWSASALRLGDHRHQAYDNATLYLQGLQSQQSKFEAEINKLEGNVDAALTAASNTTDIASKIAILEKGILSQEDEIFIASTTLIPVLVLKDQCANLTEADKTKLIQKCQTTVLDIQTLLTKLQTLPQDARVQEMTASANHQIYYLQTIQKVLTENCTTAAILSPTVYQSNIYASNWITGNQTINDIVNQYIARSQQYDNITNCPLETPFYNGISCVNCTGATPLFDMKLLRCTNCPTGQYFDPQEKVCKQSTVVPNATNVGSIGPTVGPIPAANASDVPCPATSPYWTGSACISCPQLYNFSTNACTSCPTGTTYNSTARTCDAPKPNANNPSAGSLLGALTQPQGTVPCPPETPYFNGASCINCVAPNNLFNLTSLQCAGCPTGTNYDPTNQVCVNAKPNATNLAAGTNYTGPQPVTKPGDIACPAATPYFNGTDCIACNPPTPIFNTSTLACTACPTGTAYNNVTHTCNQIYNATNPIANTNAIGTFPNLTQYDVPCPPNHPIFHNGSCVSVTCPPDAPLFNISALTCTVCPAGTVYNQTINNCSALVVTPTGSNPVGQNSTIGPLATTTSPCPPTYPFFNGTSCIQCHEPTPLFNASSLQCTACTGGFYNATTYSCAYYNAINPNATNSTIGTAPTPTNPVYCPAAYPFFNGTACLGCPAATPYFNVTTNLCVGCPAGSILNTTTHTCDVTVLKPNATNPAGVDSALGPLTTAGPSDIPCPPETPFFVNGTCIACTSPNYFNQTAGACVACPAGSAYDVTTHTCVVGKQYTSNLADPSWVSASPVRDFIETNNSITNQTKQPCPLSTPYFNGVSCISCPSGSYFNLTTNQCIQCPAGSTFVVDTHKCETNSPPYQTNVYTAPSLSYGDTSKKQWQAQYTANKQANPTIQDCPPATPYFNGINCISCSGEYMYFDLTSKDCITCQGDYQLSANGQCVSKADAGVLSPNLSAMTANALFHKKVAMHFRHRIGMA